MYLEDGGCQLLDSGVPAAGGGAAARPLPTIRATGPALLLIQRGKQYRYRIYDCGIAERTPDKRKTRLSGPIY